MTSSPRRVIPYEFEAYRSLEKGVAVWATSLVSKARAAEREQYTEERAA